MIARALRFSSGWLPLLLAVALWLPQPAGAEVPGTYEVDARTSDIHWRIYAAGALSAAGHNHVISAGSLSGQVEMKEPLRESQFSLHIPVQALVVDDPALRQRYGAEFSSQPSAKDIARTRDNMLGSRLLNAAAHPALHISGSGLEGGRIPVTLEVAGRRFPMTLPCEVTFSGDLLVARGNFSLTHAQLGLKPFSAVLGALRVAERIDFHYVIRARRK